MVLRSDARSSLPGSLGRREEFAVISAAVAAGVKTPAVHHLTEGLVRPGAWAYVMDWIEGDAIGRRVVRNKELADARQSVARAVSALRLTHVMFELGARPYPPRRLYRALREGQHRRSTWLSRCHGRRRPPSPARRRACRR